MIGQRASRFFLLAANRTRFWGLAVALFCLIPPAQALRSPVSVQPPDLTKQTSPQQTRVGDFSGLPSGRFCCLDHVTLAIAPACEACGYETASGRPQWPNRDPIGERGGLNLYTFVNNAPTYQFDPLGLDTFTFRINVSVLFVDFSFGIGKAPMASLESGRKSRNSSNQRTGRGRD